MLPQLPIMAHLVLGYPTLPESLRTAETYIAAGCAILELQIPFSHPTADGPVITVACQEAVKQGVTVSDCLAAIRALRKKYPEQEIMVMSYLNRIYVYGMYRFFQDLGEMGVGHVIVPDLPVVGPTQSSPPKGAGSSSSSVISSPQGVILSESEESEAEGLKNKIKSRPSASDSSLSLRMTPLEMDKITEMIGPAAKGEEWVRPPLVPVLAANIPDTRLDQLIAAGYDFFYLMSDFKITGSTFSLHPRLREIAGRIKSGNSAARIGIGFGINTPEQIKAVLEVADYAIIGSALIVAQQEGRLENYLENIAHSTTPAV